MDEVRRLRLEKGWSQNELAYHAKLAPSVISLIETGKRDPNATTLRKLANALGVRIPDLFEESGTGKASRRSSDQLTLLNGLEGERRESKLPEVADLLLQFGHTLLLQWEAELPDRARANDNEWLANIAFMWRAFGLINYGVLEELGADRLRDRQAWLGKYMDVNAAVHRINAAIREHSAAGAMPAEEDAVLLEPLAVA